MIIRNDLVQGSYEWLQARLGKVTGTRLKKVFAADNLSLIDELIAEQVSEQVDDEDFISDEAQRGTDLEPIARKRYEEATGNKVICDGLWQSEEYPFLVHSPDGRIEPDGAVEIKCLDTKNHVKAIRQQQLPGVFKYQGYNYFIVNPKLQWLDFISYDPRFKLKPLFIHRVTRESIRLELTQCEIDLQKFFKKLEKYTAEVIF